MTISNWPNRQPLFRYLVLASLLHALGLFCLQARIHPTAPALLPTLQLELGQGAKPAESERSPPTALRRLIAPHGTFASSPPAQAPKSIATTPPSTEEMPTIGAETLVESARRQVHEESRQRTDRKFAVSPPASLEPPPSPLAKAMARRSGSEKMLGGGIVQITTAAGTVYCLQAPPKGSDGSLNDALAVPTNCP